MSHFTTIKTKLVQKEQLLKALDDLNINYEQGNISISGYGGQQTQVEIKIPTSNPGFDMGFCKQGNSYELVADWYGIKDIDQNKFMQDINQRYAYHVTKDQLEEQDFTIVEEEVQQDKTIHLTLRRMV
jgi:hypothetical protein